ncbi:hypothetical protein OQA88_3183 [Cercophora sp. LCS_1]
MHPRHLAARPMWLARDVVNLSSTTIRDLLESVGILTCKAISPSFNRFLDAPWGSIIRARRKWHREHRATWLPLLPQEYKYATLAGERDIRIFTLYPPRSDSDDEIHGELRRVNLQELPRYDALSYSWGTELGDASQWSKVYCSTIDTMGIAPGCGIIRVTANCHKALRQLRLSARRRHLWIDAICINQEDPDERTRQVAIMSSIYALARRVVAYVGEGTTETDKLFDWLNSLDPRDLEVSWSLLLGAHSSLLSAPPAKSPHWLPWDIGLGTSWLQRLAPAKGDPNHIPGEDIAALADSLFSRRYFKRTWVLQEVSLPPLRRVHVICGTRLTTATRALHALAVIRRLDPHSSNPGSIFLTVREGLAKANGDINRNASRLLDVLIKCHGRDATDPRDRIFGVLSVARAMDHPRPLSDELRADYNLNTAQVYAKYSAFCIREYGISLFWGLMSRHRCLNMHRQKHKRRPTWAADFDEPWLNPRSVSEKETAASRPKVSQDSGVSFERDARGIDSVLALARPRIVAGFITRSGHVDGTDWAEDWEVTNGLGGDEVLVELRKGLGVLLSERRDGSGSWEFQGVVPHALSKAGVEAVVKGWSGVVVDGVVPQELVDVDPGEYLSSKESFRVV